MNYNKLHLKRGISMIVIAFFFIIYGTMIMELGLEFTGTLCFLTALCLVCYGIFLYFLKKTRFKSLVEKFHKRETWSLLSSMVLLSGIGMLNAEEAAHPVLSVVFMLFFIALLLCCVFYYKYRKGLEKGKPKSPLKAWYFPLFWSFFIGVGLLLIIFGEYEYNTLFVITSFIYYPVLLFISIRWIFKQIKEVFVLKNEQKKSELMHLKSQVNPHFFFNMLNNLYGLVGTDPTKAQALILKLSDMMRYSIYEGEKETVALSDEVVYLKNYMELHKMRYHKEISLDFQDDIQKDHQITPLLFIILLENAFKHGVENLRKDAFVRVNMSSSTEQIDFYIENNFDAALVSDTPGIGLENLQRRLALVYPEKHTIFFGKTATTYKVHLTLFNLCAI